MPRQHERRPNRLQGSFLNIFPRPRPGGAARNLLFHPFRILGTLGPGSEGVQLYIEDDDMNAHADIVTGPFSLMKVVPGEKIDVRWEETHSIGLVGSKIVAYDRLPPGNFRFTVENLSVVGVPLGRIKQVTVDVPGPLWGKWWVGLCCVSFIALCAGLWGRAVIRRKIKRQLRHVQLVSDERLRIARDLHDDLGTRLSHSSLIGAHAQADVEDEKARDC